MGEGLPATLRLGPVHLKVADLARSLSFYRDLLGLDIEVEDGDGIWLGPADRPLLVLHPIAGARPKPARSTGLYHYALLLPDRAQLGRAFRILLEAEYPLQGAADHLVSEAVYLADPDGNGIELYRDRPRPEWPHRDGELQMATNPLDANGLLRSADDDDGPALPLGTVVGHVHLHVADLTAAERFYGEALGFDLVARYERQAAFYSVGGYHHHIGLNTWAGEGAPPPPPDSVGLESFTAWLQRASELSDLADRLDHVGVEHQAEFGTLRVRDPSGNQVLFSLEGGPPAT
jgi:catechol 2,3-dioxygenase